MRRRTLLKGILGAVALRALPKPAVRGALAGEVAPPKPRGIRITGIRERTHQAFWDTVRLAAGATGGAITFILDQKQALDVQIAAKQHRPARRRHKQAARRRHRAAKRPSNHR